MCSSDITRDTSIDVKRHHRAVTLEEALVCTKFGKFNYLITIISGVILSTVSVVSCFDSKVGFSSQYVEKSLIS